VVEHSAKSFGSVTFAESHLETEVWGGWRGLFPYLILTPGTPFGLLAAAFAMPAWVSDLRVGPLEEECRKIFHGFNLGCVGTPDGRLGRQTSAFGFMVPMTFLIRLFTVWKLPENRLFFFPSVVSYYRSELFLIIKRNTELAPNLAKLHFHSPFFFLIITVSVL